MAVRIRADGSIWCAAMTSPEPGDTYLDDGVRCHLSAELRVLVTEPAEEHRASGGRWWWRWRWRWRDEEPEGATIDPFYLAPLPPC